MIEVKQVEQLAFEINQRMAYVVAQTRLEREQGLEADWLGVAEALEAASEKAKTASKAAWLITAEADDYVGDS